MAKRICSNCAFDSNGNGDAVFPATYNQGQGYCDFCSTEHSHTIECSDLEAVCYPVIDSYEFDEEANDTLLESISKDWLIMSSDKQPSQLEDFLCACLPSHAGNIDFTMKVRLKSCGDSDVDNSVEYWNELNYSIRKQNRYFPGKRREIEDLFRNMEESGFIKYVQVVFSHSLHRARVKDDDTARLTAKKMGMPPVDKTRPGRANSDGIPVLYTATTADTAIKELRPIQDSFVSVSEIKIKEPLNLYAFSDSLERVNPITLLKGNDFEQFDSDTELCIWFTRLARFQRAISRSLSEPVRKRFEDVNNYAATQFLCDWIKSEGADGVLFDSAVGSGQNVVLFNEHKIRIMQPKHYKIVSVKYDYKRV